MLHLGGPGPVQLARCGDASDEVIRRAVWNMLPESLPDGVIIKKLKGLIRAEHPQAPSSRQAHPEDHAWEGFEKWRTFSERCVRHGTPKAGGGACVDDARLGQVTINHRDIDNYLVGRPRRWCFGSSELTSQSANFDVYVNVAGGGLTGQADAIRLGITRALMKVNAGFRSALRALAPVTRDPRCKGAQKKYGQRGARALPVLETLAKIPPLSLRRLPSKQNTARSPTWLSLCFLFILFFPTFRRPRGLRGAFLHTFASCGAG